MLRARLREVDVAAHLGVDPKTVRRWLSGRVPYPSSRATLADLMGMNEADLWPEARGPLPGRSRPKELAAVYPQRCTISNEMWARFFDAAEYEITVLSHSALFLAEDQNLLRIIESKAHDGVRVRIALGDPDSRQSAACLQIEDIRSDERAAKAHNALSLYRPLTKSGKIEIRLHQKVLYNSIYRSDGQLLVNQHIYGIPAAHAPVFYMHDTGSGDMLVAYIDSFERIWAETIEIAI
jgi:hypothetical protein